MSESDEMNDGFHLDSDPTINYLYSSDSILLYLQLSHFLS